MSDRDQDQGQRPRFGRRASGGSAVRLVWPGRVWSPSSDHTRAAPSAQKVETAGDGAVRLVHGDTLDFARLLAADGLEGKVNLVYVDPPYSSERDYVAEARLDGPADGRVTRTEAYKDKWSVAEYLEMLAPRLEALARLLSNEGTLWVHLDWRAAYLVRAVLDEILGRDAFMNEIVWRRAPNLGRQATSGQFGRTLDTIVVYGNAGAKLRPPTRLEPIEPSAIRWDDEGRPFTTAPRGDYTDRSIAKLEKEGRVHRAATGKVYIKYFLTKDASGVLCRERRVDALWTDVAPLRHATSRERTGYPTQKPRALLERIIACATRPDAIVVDGFGGSGTTAAAAHALGRRAMLCDKGAVAIATARARLLREGAGVTIERLAGTPEPDASALEIEVEGKRVRLVEPKEPLAWALGDAREGVFRARWHSERAPGARPVPAAREAIVDEPAGMSVRVWGDDGAITTREVRA